MPVIFNTLHPFNLIVALAWRLFGPVAYWRVEGLPNWTLALFEAIEPREMTDSGEWNGWIEDAHAALARNIKKAPALPVSVSGQSADFGQLWLHWFAHRFERDMLAQGLAVRWAQKRGLGRCRMMRSAVSRWARLVGLSMPDREGVRRVNGSVHADRLWELWQSLLTAAAILVRSVRPKGSGSNVRGRKFRYLFAGIASPHRPFEPDRLDFAFLVRRGLLPGAECLYVSGGSLNASQMQALEACGAACVAVSTLTASLTVRQRLRLASDMLLAAGRVFIRNRGAWDVLTGMAARAVPLFAVARSAGVEVFVVGLDGGLLEPPAMPLLAAAGVRTIMWQHALAGFTHTHQGRPFRSRSVEQSALVAQSFCVWTPVDRDLLIDRALPYTARPRIRITGPLMAGDSRWLARGKHEAQRALGLALRSDRRTAAVFDLPNFEPGFLRQYRISIDRVPEDAHNAFFRDMQDALLKNPDLDLLLKPKRRTDHRFRSVAAFLELVDEIGALRRAGRVHLLDVEVDPYLPVAAADICIGMPFTSPVVAALNAGRPAFWYDPIGFVKVPYPSALEQVLVRGPKELNQRLTGLAGETFMVPEGLLAGVDDPGAEFAAILRRTHEDRGCPALVHAEPRKGNLIEVSS